MAQQTIAQRLEKYSIPEPNSGCTLWFGAIDINGYGVLSIQRDGKSIPTKAHRLAWDEKFGYIPANLHACHKCDNRACINPAHLWLGTDADNQQDKARKGRAMRGETHYRAKITAAQALAIYYDPRAYREIAVAFGAGYQMVVDIKNRRRWKHVLPSK